MGGADRFNATELALLRSSRPLALDVRPDSNLTVVEVTPGVVDAIVGGPHVDTVSSRYGLGFWFNAVDQHRYPVNMMATSLLWAVAGLGARDVPVLYGPVLVAAHDADGAPAGLSDPQIKLLGAGPELTWSAKWTLRRCVASDARRRRRVWGRARD